MTVKNKKIDVDEMINKSLEDIDALIDTDEEEEEVEPEVIVKSLKKKNLNKSTAPGDVSEDAPEDGDDAGTKDTEGEGDGTEDSEGDAETDEDDEDKDEDEDNEEGEDTEKSLEKTLESKDGVKKALEVSEFLTDLVKSLSDVIGVHDKAINKSIHANEHSDELLAKSFQGLARAQKAVLEMNVSMSKSIRFLSKKVKAMESQPMLKKSITTKTNQVNDKSFAKSLGNTETAKDDKLSKSEVLSVLTGAYEVSHEHNLGSDIVAFESTGNVASMSAASRALLKRK